MKKVINFLSTFYRNTKLTVYTWFPSVFSYLAIVKQIYLLLSELITKSNRYLARPHPPQITSTAPG